METQRDPSSDDATIIIGAAIILFIVGLVATTLL